MNSKNISLHLKKKLEDWLNSIEDKNIKHLIRDNAIVTGGALVSLITNEPINDYDIYFRTEEACMAVAEYYINKWNNNHFSNEEVAINPSDKIKIQSEMFYKYFVTDLYSKNFNEQLKVCDEELFDKNMALRNDTENLEPYQPIFISDNAITLSNKIQIVTRFYGELEEIHKNFDFIHCTCSWTSWDNQVHLPVKALECIINKELVYQGSAYPLCSLIRTRKYIERGYSINAGQYVKIAFQLNNLDLKNIGVLKDQLIGVDSLHFIQLLDGLQNLTNSINAKIDDSYVMQLIDRIF